MTVLFESFWRCQSTFLVFAVAAIQCHQFFNNIIHLFYSKFSLGMFSFFHEGHLKLIKMWSIIYIASDQYIRIKKDGSLVNITFVFLSRCPIHVKRVFVSEHYHWVASTFRANLLVIWNRSALNADKLSVRISSRETASVFLSLSTYFSHLHTQHKKSLADFTLLWIQLKVEMMLNILMLVYFSFSRKGVINLK